MLTCGSQRMSSLKPRGDGRSARSPCISIRLHLIPPISLHFISTLHTVGSLHLSFEGEMVAPSRARSPTRTLLHPNSFPPYSTNSTPSPSPSSRQSVHSISPELIEGGMVEPSLVEGAPRSSEGTRGVLPGQAREEEDEHLLRSCTRDAGAVCSEMGHAPASESDNFSAHLPPPPSPSTQAPAIASQIRKINVADSSSRQGETDEQAYARAMRDPEIQAIMMDPIMQQILQQVSRRKGRVRSGQGSLRPRWGSPLTFPPSPPFGRPPHRLSRSQRA